MKTIKSFLEGIRSCREDGRDYLAEQLEPRVLYSGTVAPDAPVNEEVVHEAPADYEPEAVGADGSPVSAIQAAQEAAADLQQFVSEGVQIVGGETDISADQDVVILNPEVFGDLGPNGGLGALSQEMAEGLLDAAAERWSVSGVLTDDQGEALGDVSVQVADLEGDLLVVVSEDNSTIFLDIDAAGREWFVDGTPLDDSEFTDRVSLNGFRAESGAARQGVDVLTILMESQGRLLGLDGVSAGRDVSATGLEEGLRRIPFADEALTNPDEVTTSLVIDLAQSAAQRWEDSGLSDGQLEALANIEYRVVDLSSGIIGSAEDGVISIDIDAAGKGWFVDLSPQEDSEFGMRSSESTLSAEIGSDAFGRFDLLTALFHEQGHVLGLDDIAGNGGELMNSLLTVGERRLPVEGQAEGVVPGARDGIHTLVGDIDTGFGAGGVVLTDFGLEDQAYAITADASGNFLVVGSASNGTHNDFAIARYTSAGVLDTTFGTGGKVVTDFGIWFDNAYSVATDAAGNVFVAGLAHGPATYDFGVVKYTSAGVLDATFGGGSPVLTDFGANDAARSIAVDASGNIVVAGYANNGSNNDFALAKYNGTTGALDASFGTGGKVITDFNTWYDTGYAMTTDASGNIFVAGDGYNYGTSTYDFAIAKYNSSGVLDGAFGSGGKVFTDFNSQNDQAKSIAIDASGRLVVAGNAANDASGTDTDFALARYSASTGILDATFGIGGKVTIDFGNAEQKANSVTTDASGNIVVVGYTGTGAATDIAIARYNSAGVLDSAFGVGGKVTTDIAGTYNAANAVITDAAGDIIVAGIAWGGSSYDFALAKYAGVETSVAVVSGNLIISDVAGGDTNDDLTIVIDGADYHIFDVTNSIDERIATASVTGNITIEGTGGNDTLTIDLSGGPITRPVFFNGGAGGNDDLVITGGTVTTATYNFTNENDGSIQLTGNALITYTGLEPITSTINATDVILNYGASSETITVSDAGGGNLTVDSNIGGETVTFARPTNSLTINAGGGNDIINVGAITGTMPSLTINGDGGNDTVNLNGDITFAAGKSLDVDLQNDSNLISDGDFELGLTSGPGNSQAPNTYGAWTESVSETAILGMPYAGLPPYEGVEALHIGNGFGPGAISQTFATTIGETYEVSLSVIGWSGGVGTVTATANGAPIGDYVAPGGNVWGTGSHTFVATGTSTTLQIQNISGASTIDDVQVHLVPVGTVGTDTVNFGPGANVVLSGAGTATVKASGAVAMWAGGSSLITQDGDITIEANQQATQTVGNFYGAQTNNMLIEATGSGNITVKARAGIGGTSTAGIAIDPNSTVRTNTGDITIVGTGGTNGGGQNNGVQVHSGSIVESTNGGNIDLTGVAGSQGMGIRVLFSGKVRTTGAGTIALTGTGGAGAGPINYGVAIDLGTTGTGTAVSNSGSGLITINGTAGTGGVGFFTGSGGTNRIGFDGTNAYSGNVIINADSMSITDATIQTTGTVTLTQQTSGKLINLGGADSGTTLGLTDAELDQITAGTLQIGNANSGAITVSSAITHTNSNAVILTAGTGQNINLDANLTTAGGALTLSSATVLGANATVDTTNAGGVAAGAAISFGSTINLGANTLTHNAGATNTSIASAISGAGGGLTKLGTGTLTLNARNTYTGATVIEANGGTLSLNMDTRAIADDSEITVKSGGTLEIRKTNALLRLAGDAAIILDGGTLDHAAGAHAHINNITLKNGAVWKATSVDSYQGRNVDLHGTVTSEGTASSIGTFTAGIYLDGARRFDVFTDIAVSANLVGPGGLVKSQGAALTLSGTNSYAGTTTVSAGTLDVDGSITSAGGLNLTGGTFTGAGTATFGGSSTWTGGSMTGSGVTNFDGSLAISNNRTLDGRTLNSNAAGSIGSGTFTIRNGATFTNTATGTFTVNNAATLNLNGGGATSSFVNAGTLIKNGAGGFNSGVSSVEFDNSGTLNLNDGSMYQIGGTNTGLINLADGLYFSVGDYTFDAGTQLLGTGILDANIGLTTFKGTSTANTVDFRIASGQAEFAAGADFATTGSFNMFTDNGQVKGAGTSSFGTGSTWSAGSFQGSGVTNFTGTLDITAAGRVINDRAINLEGATTISTGTYTSNGTAAINNKATGTFTVATGETVTVNGAGAFTNAGTLTVDGSFTSTNPLDNSGLLAGIGTFNGSVIVDSGGTVAPGTSPGILTTGSVNFTTGSSLDIEIGGSTPGNTSTNHDQLDVNGTVTIGTGATLDLSSFSGFIPVGGEELVIVDNDGTDAISGTFVLGTGGTDADGGQLAEGDIITNFLGSGLEATVSYAGSDGNDLVLVVGSATYDFSAATYSAAEGNATNTTLVVTVDRSISTFGASSVEVALASGTTNGATAGTDFTAGPITVNFADGESSKTVSIEILGDSTVELDETIALTLQNPSGSGEIGTTQATAELTLTNDDAATVTIADATVTEGGNLEFAVTLDHAVDVDTVITYSTADGTATTADSDYTALTNQTLTILAGNTSGTITVATTGDNTVELDETLTLTIDNVSANGRDVAERNLISAGGSEIIAAGTEAGGFNAYVGGYALLGNNGSGGPFLPGPVVDTVSGFAVGDTINFHLQGQGHGTGNWTLKNGDGQVVRSYNYSVANPGGDFSYTVTGTNNDTTLTQTLTHSNGGLITYYPGSFGGPWDFGVTYTPPATTGGNGTIENDDSATVSIGDATITEGGDLEFAVTLTNPVDVDTEITYSTSDGTATTADSDYTAQTNQTLTILAGELTGTITVATTDDNNVEFDETVNVTLSAVSVGGRDVTILDGTAEGVIVNDDAETTVELSGGNLIITDSNGADTDDNLTLSTAGGVLTITAAGNPLHLIDLVGALEGAGTGDLTTSVSLPLTAFTGNIIVRTLGGNDSIHIENLDLTGTQGLIIEDGTGTDSVTFQAASSDLNNGNVSVAADSIAVDAAVSTGGGDVSFTASGDITLGAEVATAGGQFTADADSDNNGSGTFSLTAGSAGVPAMPAGSVLHYRMDESPATSGTAITDLSGSGNDATVVRGSGDAAAAGQFGGAIDFPGGQITDYVISDPVTAWPTTEFTVSFWAQTTQASGTYLFSYAVSGTDNEILIGTSTITVKGGTVSAPLGISDGSFHHVAITWQSAGGAVAVHVDGVQQFTGTLANGATLGGGGTLVLGQDQDFVGGGFQSSQAYDGLLDEVAVFNRVLSPAEIAALAAPTGGGIGGSVAAGAGDITIEAADAVLNGQLSGTGTLTIAPSTGASTIGIGGGTGTLNLDDTELAFLTNGFSSITIGDVAAGTGVVDVDSSTFTDDVTIVGGSIDVTDLNAGTNDATLIARTGAITNGGGFGGSGTATVSIEVTADDVTLNAAGDIGTSAEGEEIGLSANSITTTTDSASTMQYLSEVDTIVISGLDAGTGTATLVVNGEFDLSTDAIDDATSVVVEDGVTFDVNGASDTFDTITINAGGTLKGDGTLDANVIDKNEGEITPGDGTTGLINTGDLTLEAGSFYTVDLSGAASDTIVSNGNVAIAGNLDIVIGATAVTPGTVFTLIENISGTTTGQFNGLPEGSIISLAIPNPGTPPPAEIPERLLRISYVGGDGNDVTLTVSPEIATTNVWLDGTTLTLEDIAGNDTEDNLFVRVEGGALIITDLSGNNLGTLINGAVQTEFNEISFTPGTGVGQVNFTDIVINTGNEADSVTVGDLGSGATGLPGSLTIVGGDGQDRFIYNGAGSVLTDGSDFDVTAEIVTFASGSSLTVGTSSANTGGITVDAGNDGTAGAGVGTFTGIELEAASLAVTGDGDVDMVGEGGDTQSRNHGIALDESSILTENGGISLEGIVQATNITQSSGVLLNDSTVGQTGLNATGVIAIDGTSGGTGVGSYNIGVTIDDGSEVIALGDGSIAIDGEGADGGSRSYYNYGVKIARESALSSVDGTVSIDGEAGAGHSYNSGISLIYDSSISVSGSGDIVLSGAGGDGVHRNYGVGLERGVNLETGTGSILLTGTGGSGTGGNESAGVRITDSVVRQTEANATGVIAIDGTGVSGGARNAGVLIDFGSAITALGSTAIDIDGIGADGNTFGFGINIVGASALSSVDGDVTLDGTGGDGTASTASNNMGVSLESDASVTVSGSGDIALRGTGGDGARGYNAGVALHKNGASLETGSGSITLVGIAGGGLNSNYNNGVKITGSSLKQTAAGLTGATITIDGTGSGTGMRNTGVEIDVSSVITALGETIIDIDGVGADGRGYSQGVRIGRLTSLSSVNGNVTIDGEGGDGGRANQGVTVESGSGVTVSGTGGIMVNGTGGDGTGYNTGVTVSSGTGKGFVTNSGAISVTGTSGTGSSSKGLIVGSRSVVQSLAGGSISLSGTSRGSGSQNSGLELSYVTVDTTGDVILFGAGSSTASGYYNRGIYLLYSTIRGNSLNITGNGGTGSNYNEGVRVMGGSLSGDLNLTGTANSATTGRYNTGVYLLRVDLSGAGAGPGIFGTGGGGTGYNHGIHVIGSIYGGSYSGTAGDGTLSEALKGAFL